MKATTVCALAGACMALGAQAEMLTRWPVYSAGAIAVGLLGLAYGLTRRDRIADLSDAVLHEAHRAAMRLGDHAGADAVRAEFERRAEERGEVRRA